MTLVEVVVSTAIGATLLISAMSLADATGDASNSAHVRTGVFIRASRATERLVKELQTASTVGEDVNENALLDPAEDTNSNERLDADWSLADGSTATSITFNKVQRDWTWSGPITWSIQGGNLVRTEGGKDEIVCREVDAFSVRRAGNEIVLSVHANASDRKGRTWSETSERTCYVRN